MAQIISTSVYDFSSAGNKKVSIAVMGLPVPGAFVSVASSPDPAVYCYSKITYPGLGVAGKEYLTAETLSQILTKMNA